MTDPTTNDIATTVRNTDRLVIDALLSGLGARWTGTSPTSALITVTGSPEEASVLTIATFGRTDLTVTARFGDEPSAVVFSNKTVELVRDRDRFVLLTKFALTIPNIAPAHRRDLAELLGELS